jgi:catechol 2,3-dioxygenase-like lactoylglutathione lyase family enzyme
VFHRVTIRVPDVDAAKRFYSDRGTVSGVRIDPEGNRVEIVS